MRLTDSDGELWGLPTLKKEVPHLNYGPDARFPIIGAAVQRRAGTARHDAVAWGYARGADQLGVDILQNCEVTGVTRENDRVTGLETSRGRHKGQEGRLCRGGPHLAAVADGGAWKSYPSGQVAFLRSWGFQFHGISSSMGLIRDQQRVPAPM